MILGSLVGSAVFPNALGLPPWIMFDDEKDEPSIPLDRQSETTGELWRALEAATK